MRILVSKTRLLRSFGIAAIVTGLTACGSDKPVAYNEIAAHPFVITQSSAQLDLGGVEPRERDRRVRAFAVARPNDGSSFIVTADATTGAAVQRVLLTAGIAPGDIALVTLAPPGPSAKLTRVDRVAHASACEGAAPEPDFRLGTIDDGFGHSNANSVLLGCAVRRNIAAMTADPRTLFVADPADGSDGARAAGIYDKWRRGESPASTGALPPATANVLGTNGSP